MIFNGTSLVKNVVRYFDLRPKSIKLRGNSGTPHSSNRRESSLVNLFSYHLFAYAAVVLGVLGRAFLEDNNEGFSRHLKEVIVAMIVGAVIYPATSRAAGINPEASHPLHFFVAFQNGFFWKTILSELSK
jgi:hypothetical protein